MKSIRNIIDSITSEIDYLVDENPDLDVTDIKKEVDALEGLVDDLESNNTDAKDVIDAIDDVSYLDDLASDLKTPIEANAKILY